MTDSTRIIGIILWFSGMIILGLINPWLYIASGLITIGFSLLLVEDKKLGGGRNGKNGQTKKNGTKK